MKPFLLRLFHTMASTLRERVHLALEVMALRHQLAVSARSGKRPHFSPVDQCFWVLLSTMWARCTVALAIVQADTVRRWRRQGVWRSLRWCRPGKRPGRSAITAETRAMIRRLSQENTLWGAPRIHGQLAMLGIKVSRTTVAKYMTRRRRPPSYTSRTFLRNHGCELIAGGVYADMRT
jgi:putative transposase